MHVKSLSFSFFLRIRVSPERTYHELFHVRGRGTHTDIKKNFSILAWHDKQKGKKRKEKIEERLNPKRDLCGICYFDSC